METKALDQLLGQLRTAAAMAQGGVKPQAATGPKSVEFTDVLKASLDQVNGMQQNSRKLAREFELGIGETNLQDVMVSLQKANISFQQVIQVRNKLVSAYQEIMNMQV
jgi:flagellar hook-basal body complex protein FliE